MKVTYYVAMSLDGYIATKEGGVEWLSCVEREGEDYGYRVFFDSVDALVMGRRTYDSIVQMGEWSYGKKPYWVLSRKSDLTPRSILSQASAQGVQHLWVVGGGEVAGAFAQERLIHKFIFSIVPIFLGEGVAVIGDASLPPLRLEQCKHYSSGLVQLEYVFEA